MLQRLTFLLALLAAASLPLLAACPPTEVPCGLLPVLEDPGSGSELLFDRCTGRLSLEKLDGGESPLPPAPEDSPAIAWTTDELTVSMTQGRYVFDGIWGLWQALGEGRLEEAGWIVDDNDHPASLTWKTGEAGSIELSLEVEGEVDRVSIAFGCRDGERFYGTGARPQGTDHSGETVLLYTAEQGIGQTDFDLDEFDFLRGRTGDSYFPVPWTVTDRGLGAAIGGTPIARMYLCGAEEPGVLRFEAWSNRLDLQLFPAESTRQAVGAWTLTSGPPAPAPDWAYGPWVAVQHGSDELLRSAELLRQQGIPATALWAQDWIGGGQAPLGGYDLDFHWEWDEELYPDLPEHISHLHDQGLAFLGYFNPFVTDEFDEWTEAQEGDFLPRTPEGATYEFSIVDRQGSVVDLSKPEAYQWTKDYLLAAAEMGQDGWMCDFAEWMPFDAQVHSGSGQDLHNRYPLLWQQVNMEALEEVHGEGNALCFNRSGWTGTQAIAPVTWGGDQETSFARDDGMPTAREIGVGLGLSGIGRYGSDLAGFSSVWDGPATRELYWRWVEMAAFEPVMRTHDGLAADENWHWEEDEETLEHFALYARWHMRLLPYLQILDREYMQDGLPFMRHAVLVEDGLSDELRDAADQHFLGDNLLIAPILTEGAEARELVLPPGLWHSLLGPGSLESEGSGGTVTVQAPLGTTPVLARGGSILPLGDPEVVTSYPSSDPNVVDSGDRSDRLHLVGFSGDGSQGRLADGTEFTFSAAEVEPSIVPSLDGVELEPSCEDAEADNCIEALDLEGGSMLLRISWGEGPRSLEGGGWSLSISEGGQRSGTFTLRFPASLP
ncbi:MAG: TIM-barrel domain-containing protein [Myxococcota bacterium]|nr:TIM-barrel domain-containing protein [Myxococcota bacterium]